MPERSGGPATGWIGHELAGHRIEAVVGQGGMGVVFRATHLRLRRTVALKVLPAALAQDQAYRRRFEREAAIAASLEHPNVVPIYDAGHADGVLYLSMRFVAGVDLGAVIRSEGRLGIDRLCALLGPVADALDAVHEAGLVHRDVKPANVLVSPVRRPGGGEQVYLCDFGIAKQSSSANSAITSAGQFLGTLQYCSPEQIEGGWLDGRSDQYGLACLAFQCLTGSVPYPREQPSAVIYAHLAADPPRPSALCPQLPAEVDAAVMRATAKHPDRRFPTCSAFVAALRAAGGSPAPRHAAAPERAEAAVRVNRPTLPLAGVAPVGTERISTSRRSGVGLATAAEVPTEAASERAGAPEPGAAVAPAGAGTPAGPAPAAGTPAAGTPSSGTAASGTAASGSEVSRSAASGLPAPLNVQAARGTVDRSVTVSWTACGPEGVEYKISQLGPGDKWRVVGRTRATSIVDGGVAPDAEIPVYAVVARLGGESSGPVRSDGEQAVPLPAPRAPAEPAPREPAEPVPAARAEPPATARAGSVPAARAEPAPAATAPAGSAPDGRVGGRPPAIRDLGAAPSGALLFDWPSGITEAMVVVRQDRPPERPDDPAATAWKITNTRYQMDGGVLLPASVGVPCHVAVASCWRDGGRLVVAPGFDPTARLAVPG